MNSKILIILIALIYPFASYSQLKDVKNLVKILESDSESITAFLNKNNFKHVAHGNGVYEGKLRPYYIYGYNGEAERIYIHLTSTELPEIYKIEFVTINKELIVPYKRQLKYLDQYKDKYIIEFIGNNYPKIIIKKKK